MEKYLWVLISGLKPKNEKSISRILTNKREKIFCAINQD